VLWAAMENQAEDCFPDASEADVETAFVYYDRDFDGRLTKQEFRKLLWVTGAMPSNSVFEEACETYGSTPDLASASAAVGHLRKKTLTSGGFADLFSGVAQQGHVDAETLHYIVTHYADRLSEAEADELITLAAPDANKIDVFDLAETLMPLRKPPIP